MGRIFEGKLVGENIKVVQLLQRDLMSLLLVN